MVQINLALREVNCKVVFYGPGRSGKTTNLEMIHAKAPKDSVGDLVSLSTEQDRTLFFDFLPLNLGSVAGMTTKFQLYTVPGQVYYNRTRKLVLQGADGVVFVADSSKKMMKENLESLENLVANLAENGLDIATLPLVLQWNKRDLPDAQSVQEMNAVLNRWNVPTCEAIAVKGEGVFPTLKLVAGLVIKKLNAEYGQGSGARAQPVGPAAHPAAPAPAAAVHPPPVAAAAPPAAKPVAPPAPAPAPKPVAAQPAAAAKPAPAPAHPAPAPAPAPAAPATPRAPVAPAAPAAHQAPPPPAPKPVAPPAPPAQPKPVPAAPAPVVQKAPPPAPKPAAPAPAPQAPAKAPSERRAPAQSHGEDDNPIRREIERRKREAVTQEKPRPVQTIKSIQKNSRTGTVLIIVGVAVVVAVVALITLHVTGLF